MKKLLAVLLAALMIFSVAGAMADGLSNPGELPIWTGAEPAKITVLTPQMERVTDWEDNYYTNWIQDACNVDLDFTFLPLTDPKDKLAVMVAGGEEFQDVLNIQLDLATEQSYCEAGVIKDVTEYFKAGLAVNCDAAVAAYPDMYLISNITTAEGSVYAIPKIQASPSNETKYKMWVNQGWLDNLGIAVPTTTEEFYEMLKAFKEKDANGNGDPTDEIPFITSTGFGGTATKFLFNAFVFEGDNDMFMLKDGHVTTSYLQDAWFEAADFCKKLVDEGLLAPESFTYSNNDLYAVAHTEEDVVGVMTNSSCAFMGPATDEYRLRFVCLNPLTGPEGVCFSAFAASATTGCWHVTEYAADPELAFRVGDFQFCEEGFLRGRFGVENMNWMTVEDYTAANPDVEVVARYAAMGYAGKYVFYNDTRDQENNNLYWYEHIPYFSGSVEANGMVAVHDPASGVEYSLAANATARQETGTGYYQLVKPGSDVYVPNLAFTADELSELAEFRANLRSYVNEQRTNYIIGQASDLSNPEQFVENLKTTFSLDRLLEIADAAYQRQYAK